MSGTPLSELSLQLPRDMSRAEEEDQRRRGRHFLGSLTLTQNRMPRTTSRLNRPAHVHSPIVDPEVHDSEVHDDANHRAIARAMSRTSTNHERLFVLSNRGPVLTGEPASAKKPPPPRLVVAAVSKEHELVCKFIDRANEGGGLLPPNEFFCPLSLQAMRDPACYGDGQLYDRAWIVKAKAHGRAGATAGSLISPVTNVEVSPEMQMLYSCKPMIGMMERWVQQAKLSLTDDEK